MVQVTENVFIVARHYGNMGRFLNHDCIGNCTLERWVINDRYRLAIYSKYELEGTLENPIELTFRYNREVDSFTCLCYECAEHGLYEANDPILMSTSYSSASRSLGSKNTDDSQDNN